MFGDPETMPGGNKPFYQASIILRVYGKNKMDTKISSVMPVAKDVELRHQEMEVPDPVGLRQVRDGDHGAQRPEGRPVRRLQQVRAYLETFGEFEKAPKKGWNIFGEHYDTIQPFETKLYTDPEFGYKVRQSIIERMVSGGTLLETGEAA